MSTTACPYCRCGFEGEEALTCEACATPHHADCYAENGGCTVFGCAKAPADEPKVSISSADLSQARPAAAAAPPPPNPALTTSVPPPPRPAGAPPRIQVSGPVPARELSFGGYGAVSAGPITPYTRRRSRTNYVLLGVFLGGLGVHNFYAGYTKRAVGQLLVTLLSFFFLSWVAWIWAVVEVCIVKQDGDGTPFL